MSTTSRYVAGEGPLGYGRVLREAWGMFRGNTGRVAVVALVMFVPPPLLAAALEALHSSLKTRA